MTPVTFSTSSETAQEALIVEAEAHRNDKTNYSITCSNLTKELPQLEEQDFYECTSRKLCKSITNFLKE